MSDKCLLSGKYAEVSYMSAQVLFYLLNKLKKRDKMRDATRILSLFYKKLINSIIHKHEC